MKVKPKLFIIIGISLMFLGILFPLLMVTGTVKSSFVLNFLSYIFSIAGLFLASIGGMTIVKQKRDDDKKY
jgi:hypothetical protein